MCTESDHGGDLQQSKHADDGELQLALENSSGPCILSCDTLPQTPECNGVLNESDVFVEDNEPSAENHVTPMICDNVSATQSEMNDLQIEACETTEEVVDRCDVSELCENLVSHAQKDSVLSSKCSDQHIEIPSSGDSSHSEPENSNVLLEISMNNSDLSANSDEHSKTAPPVTNIVSGTVIDLQTTVTSSHSLPTSIADKTLHVRQRASSTTTVVNNEHRDLPVKVASSAKSSTSVNGTTLTNGKSRTSVKNCSPPNTPTPVTSRFGVVLRKSQPSSAAAAKTWNSNLPSATRRQNVGCPMFVKPLLKTKTVKAGGLARLEVQVDGRPKPHVQWFKDGQPLYEDRRRKIVQSGDGTTMIMILNANPEDQAVYKCVASSIAGSADNSCELVVVTK